MNDESNESSPAKPLTLPRPAINLARRVLQLMAGGQSISIVVRIVRIDGVWYLIDEVGNVEKLG